MYPSKGGGGYGQQAYSGQQAYGQIAGVGDVGAQHAMASQQQGDISGFRTQATQGAQYGGPYAAVYGSSALTSALQAGGTVGKGAASSSLQGRMGYASTLQESSKFSSGALGSSLGMTADDYVSAATRGFGQKGDPYSASKVSDYPSIDRRHYGDQASYLGRDLQSDPARRYTDSVSMGQQHQAEMHDHVDQASLLRQQQLLKAQSLQTGSDLRQAEYLAARAAPMHHGSQDFGSYGGRMDVDPRSLSVLGGTPYGGQHAASILGGAPRRNLDDLYTQGSSGAVYGVGLPPGRDYVSGKGLLGPPLESDYLPRGHPSHGVSVADDRKDDRAYRRELELRDEERRREQREKEKEREKERERERDERERRRERERERERLERREKERERELKRARERSPRRASRDRRASSLLKDERTARRSSPRRSSPPRRASPRRASPRRASPRREAVHRRRSPVKEKKREYVCKVFPFSLVDVERDYLSLSKRYPRLSVSPECSKVVLHWPKQSLHLSLYTPVSFEHEYIELDSKGEEKAVVRSDETSRAKQQNIVWNAKVLLMSGMSSNAVNEMSSYRSTDEKVVHFNSILRFSILKKDLSFMAIGGPWNASVDGGDPAQEESALIQTARRYLKDIAQLDLQTCQHWNRFLEIHYDRVGEDGLFSHKEITVLFVPDLSECLPSLDEWRTQWLAHKREAAERERILDTKKMKSPEKKESARDVNAGKADDTKDASKESNKKNAVEQKGKESVQDEKPKDEKPKEENAVKAAAESKADAKKATQEATQPAADNPKPGKKKIIKKVVKGKGAAKKAAEAAAGDATAKAGDKMDVDNDGDKQVKQEAVVKEEETPEPVSVKTLIRKKLVKKVPAKKSAVAAANISIETVKKPEIEAAVQDEKTSVKKEPEESATPVETVVKTTGGKKKIIRRVVKKKVSPAGGKNADSNAVKKETVKEEDNGAAKQAGEAEEKDEVGASKPKEKTKEAETVEKDSGDETKSKTEKESAKSSTPEAGKVKDTKKDDQPGKKEKLKDEKEKSKDAKQDGKQKPNKEKEKAKPEEPPKHPGLFMCTKRSKGSKMRSMCLSLDGLLDYNDKDIEESTFELSVFAESLNEMLQYQMGCRLLSFLEKLRKRYIVKKNQRKREREEKAEKQKEEAASKRAKVDDGSAAQKESSKSEKQDASNENKDETLGKDGSGAGEDKVKMEVESDNDNVEEGNKSDEDNENDDEVEEEEEEDPEEIFEDEEMNDVAPTSDAPQKDESAAKQTEAGAEAEKAKAEEESGKKTDNETNSTKTEAAEEKTDKEKDDDTRSQAKSDTSKEVVYDKEILQAFRYFDHNRVGYIRVDDMRCLLHNLGKFLSNRDVKELVQSALFESNSAMDNRIFYKKLVKLTDL